MQVEDKQGELGRRKFNAVLPATTMNVQSFSAIKLDEAILICDVDFRVLSNTKTLHKLSLDDPDRDTRTGNTNAGQLSALIQATFHRH